jgi:apolipoprotein N-acyltransferase
VRRLAGFVLEEARARPRAFVAAAVAGALLAAPTLLPWCWPLAFVALVPYLDAFRPFTRDGRARTGVLLALTMAVVWYTSAGYWLFSLVRYSWTAWLAALAIIGLGLSEIVLFPLAVRFVHRRLGVPPALSIPFAWITMERLRWLGDLYFPWFDLGYDLSPVPLLVQFADVLGVSGVGFWIVTVNVCVAELYAVRADPRRRLVRAALLVAVVGLPLPYDVIVWSRHDPAARDTPRVRVTLVQPNVPQQLKWDTAARREVVAQVRAATEGAAASRPDLLVLPETVIPLLLRTDGTQPYSVDTTSVAQSLGNPGVPLLAGVMTVEGRWPAFRFTNSAILYDAGGTQAGRYDKTRLVPIVEAIPHPRLLGWITWLASTPVVSRWLSQYVGFGFGALRPGLEPAVVRVDGLPPLGVLICYESIFPDIAREERRQGAGLLVSISDDAWFGETAAPYQHAAFLVLRAVENRTWVVRAANTGISAIYNPRGTVIVRTRLGTRDVLDFPVPAAGAPPPFTRMRWDPTVTVCLLVTSGLVAAAWLAGARPRRDA